MMTYTPVNISKEPSNFVVVSFQATQTNASAIRVTTVVSATTGGTDSLVPVRRAFTALFVNSHKL